MIANGTASDMLKALSTNILSMLLLLWLFLLMVVVVCGLSGAHAFLLQTLVKHELQPY